MRPGLKAPNFLRLLRILSKDSSEKGNV